MKIEINIEYEDGEKGFFSSPLRVLCLAVICLAISSAIYVDGLNGFLRIIGVMTSALIVGMAAAYVKLRIAERISKRKRKDQ